MISIEYPIAQDRQSNLAKGGIKHRITEYNELGRSKNLSCPYCPSPSFKLAELNVHMYLKNMSLDKDNAIALKKWPQVWDDIRTQHRS